MTVKILRGDCREVLEALPAASIHCVVTSPPYWGLRDYGVPPSIWDGDPAWRGCLGLEPTPSLYVEHLRQIMRQVWRVIRPDGALWLNLGDSYAGRTGGPRDADRWPKRAPGDHLPSRRAAAGAKPKDLLMIPARVALALQDDGWWVRSDIIWEKPSCMPESVHDRPTQSHEHVFLLTKADRYFFDAHAIRERAVSGHPSGNGFKRAARRSFGGSAKPRGSDVQWSDVGGTRNARSVWRINSTPFLGAHFATMAPGVADRCIRASTSEFGCCPTCGAPWRRIIVKGMPDEAARRAAGSDALGGYTGQSIKGHDAAPGA